MIREEEVYRIGQLGKPHGVKGEIAFNFVDDVFDRTDECDYLVLRLDGILVPFFIEEYRFKTDTVALVKFDGLDSAEKARRFTGTDVFFPKKFLEGMDDEELSWSYFVGFRIEDKHLGVLGKVVEIDESTINTLFVVRPEGGGELLIPAQEVFIVDMDHEERVIVMDLPEGMVGEGGEVAD